MARRIGEAKGKVGPLAKLPKKFDRYGSRHETKYPHDNWTCGTLKLHGSDFELYVPSSALKNSNNQKRYDSCDRDPVLPRAAPLDVSGLGTGNRDPFLHGFGDELRSVVGADVSGNAPQHEAEPAALRGETPRAAPGLPSSSARLAR